MDNEKADRRRLAELAITERVFKRVLVWFGIIGTFLTICFGVFGIQLQNLFQTYRDQIEIKTRSAVGQIADTEKQSQVIVGKIKEIQKDLDAARLLVAQVRKLRSDVDFLQSQVEGFYRTQRRELFGAHSNRDRINRIEQRGGRGKLTLSLREEPISNSLRVRCGGVELYRENYSLEGNKLLLEGECDAINFESKNPADDFVIEVLYHVKK